MSTPERTETVRLAPLRRTDAPRCAAIERELFAGDDPWSERAFHAELAAGYHYLGAYAESGQLAGYGGIALLGRSGDFESEVHTIGVAEQWQGAGIGSLLLDGLLAFADEYRAPVYLEVRTDNRPAMLLYERRGFRVLGVRKGYYQPSMADAYTMVRDGSAA